MPDLVDSRPCAFTPLLSQPDPREGGVKAHGILLIGHCLKPGQVTKTSIWTENALFLYLFRIFCFSGFLACLDSSGDFLSIRGIQLKKPPLVTPRSGPKP